MGTRSVRAVYIAVLALLAVGLLASPARAQEGEASITVDQAHPATGSTHYFVSVTTSDGTPITDAEVVATPIDPDGTEHDPVTLESSGDGVYQGVVPMNASGTWTIRFVSSNPPASTEHTQQVGAASTETAPPTTGTTTTSAPSTSTTETPDPTDSVTTTDPGTDTAAPAADSDDDGSSALPFLLLAGLAAVAVLAVVLYLRRGKQDDETHPDATEPGDPTAE